MQSRLHFGRLESSQADRLPSTLRRRLNGRLSVPPVTHVSELKMVQWPGYLHDADEALPYHERDAYSFGAHNQGSILDVRVDVLVSSPLKTSALTS